ncbi:MAG: DUF305 domain-containing protein [Gemmatimonadaceae bacterium]
MIVPHSLRAPLLCCVAGLAGCASGATHSSTAPPPVPEPVPVVVRTNADAIAQARADSVRRPYTAADVRFMTNMIGHHAQAIEMSRLAPTREADAAVLRLAARIINAQQDEIVLMQQWLVDREKPLPDPHAHHGGHAHLMPGMLTPEQTRQLEAARGAEFDRLFLTFMIQHHNGAVVMVKELFDTYGAGLDDVVFKFASDVNVDQTTEVRRMEQMLASFSTTQPTQP